LFTSPTIVPLATTTATFTFELQRTEYRILKLKIIVYLLN